MDIGSLSRTKAAGAWRWPPTPSRAMVKERVEIFLYFPSGPLWTVQCILYLYLKLDSGGRGSGPVVDSCESVITADLWNDWLTANFRLSNVFPRNASVPLRHNSYCPCAGTTHYDVLTLFFGILSTFILAHLLSACRRRNRDWRESGSRNGWSFCTPLTSMGNWRSVTRMTQTFHRSAAAGSLS